MRVVREVWIDSEKQLGAVVRGVKVGAEFRMHGGFEEQPSGTRL